MKKVLFLCTHNSSRSQMAEGLLRHYRGDIYKVFSAGTEQSSVNPYAIKVMQEIGIDISQQKSKLLDPFIKDEFDSVVTVCDKAKEACPFFSGSKKLLHKSFEDPSQAGGSEENILVKFRGIRDEIKDWIEKEF